jgi:hypothetical protein
MVSDIDSGVQLYLILDGFYCSIGNYDKKQRH